MSGAMAFFVFVFLVCQIIATVIQGGGMARTELTATLDEAETAVMHVESTSGFLNASAAVPASVLVVGPLGREFVGYTGRTATTFTGLARGETDPQTKESQEAVTHAVSADSTPTVMTVNLDVIDSFVGYSVGTAQGTTGSISLIFATGKALLFSLPRMLMWDYPWLAGHVAIFRIPLFALSAGFIWATFMATVGVAQGLLRI